LSTSENNDNLIINYDDLEDLKAIVDNKIEASIICRYNHNIPNFLSIVYANKLFYQMFDLNESKVVGHNYDFLFDDIDLDNFSEDQAEYSRLLKAVRDRQESSIVISSTLNDKSYTNYRLHISYYPNISKNSSALYYKDFAIFSFIKIKQDNPENNINVKSKSNIALLRVLERTLRNERTLREIANLIISDEPIDELAKTIAKILCEHLKCDRCIIHDFKEDKANFVIEYCSNYAREMIPYDGNNRDTQNIKLYINFQNEFYKKFGSNSKKSSISIAQDIIGDKNFATIKNICEQFGISSQIAVTTTFNGVVNGGIYLHQTEKREWNQDEIDLIEIVAEQFSIALDRASSIQKVMITNHALMEKTLQLKESLKQEQEMRKMQNEFVALVSHEFKTPLQIIDGNRELITRKLKNNNYTEQGVYAYLDKIKSGIQRMNGLINSTLQLAKMENSDGKIKVEKQHTNLFKLIDDIIDKNNSLAVQENIAIHYKINDLPTEYLTDGKLLDHVFSNLISNAIKYSHINSHVKVIGKVLDDCIAIRVIDNGIGIPEKDLNNVGKKFFRAGNSISVAGTGIGIYLTKHFIDLLEGKFIIDSQEGKGTTVTVILKK